MSRGLSKGGGQCSGAPSPISPSLSARAVMPSTNSVGKLASDALAAPSARQPSKDGPILKQVAGFSSQGAWDVTCGTPPAPDTVAASQLRASAASATDR